MLDQDWQIEREEDVGTGQWILRVHGDGDPELSAYIFNWEQFDAFVNELRAGAEVIWGPQPHVWTLEELQAKAREVDAG
jgi:hypothetical protein